MTKEDKIQLILLDIDGVIYNFVKSYFKLLNVTSIKESDITNYDMSTTLGLSKIEFWNNCDNADGLFDTGEFYEWTNNLINVCNHYSNNNVIFCSNPGNNPKHWGEKRRLIDRFNNEFNFNMHMILTQSKHTLSLPNVVLIDDHPNNITRFNNGNGIGILFPQYWNNSHESLLNDRVGYIDCTLDDINIVGFSEWKNIKKT